MLPALISNNTHNSWPVGKLSRSWLNLLSVEFIQLCLETSIWLLVTFTSLQASFTKNQKWRKENCNQIAKYWLSVGGKEKPKVCE